MHLSLDEFIEKVTGMIVESASYDEDAIHIVGVNKGEKMYLHMLAYGDCCSRSWIESVNDIADLVGAEIYSFERESSHSEWTDVGDKIDYDFYKFKTSKGYVDVEMRNESNGYYTGYFEYQMQPYPQT